MHAITHGQINLIKTQIRVNHRKAQVYPSLSLKIPGPESAECLTWNLKYTLAIWRQDVKTFSPLSLDEVTGWFFL